MLIIYGTHNFRKVLAQPGPYTCNHCGSVTHFEVVRVRTWFTIFWIPLFPVSGKHYHTCPVCQQGEQIKREQSKQIVESLKQPQQPALPMQSGAPQTVYPMQNVATQTVFSAQNMAPQTAYPMQNVTPQTAYPMQNVAPQNPPPQAQVGIGIADSERQYSHQC